MLTAALTPSDSELNIINAEDANKIRDANIFFPVNIVETLGA